MSTLFFAVHSSTLAQTSTTTFLLQSSGSDGDPTLAEVLRFLGEHLLAVVTWVAVVAASVFAYLQWRDNRRLRAAVESAAVTNVPSATPTPIESAADHSGAHHYSDALDRVLKTKTLTVGVIVASPWFIWPRPGVGVPTGIYPTIFSEIASRKSLSVRYVPIRNDEIYDLLDSGEIDLAAQLLQTIERAQKARFSALIHHVKLVAVVRQGQTKIKVRADLRKPSVKCAVVSGEIGHQIAPEFGMTEDRLVVLNTYDVPSVFYLVHGGNEADVAITTGARWIELQQRDRVVAANLEAIINPLQLVPAGCLLQRDELRLGEWLDEQTQIARSARSVVAHEDKLIRAFSAAVEKI